MTLVEKLTNSYKTGLARAKALAGQSERTADEAAELSTLLGEAAVDGSLKAIKAEIESEQAAARALADADDFLKTPVRKVPFQAHEGQPKGDGFGNDSGVAGTKATKIYIDTGDSEVDKKYPTGGFKSLGHLCHTVIQAAGNDGHALKSLGDWRDLAVKAAAGMGITADPTADIFVPMEFSQQIFQRMEGIEWNLMNRVNTLTVRGNTIRLPAWNDANRSETYRFGGVRAYWEGEGDSATASKIDQTRYKDFRLHKLMGLVYLSNELMEDSPFAIDQIVNEKAAEAMAFKVSEAIWSGTGAGVGKPLGVHGSAARVSVAKESSQVAATINSTNVFKMWSRLTASCRSRAVWHINQDTEPQLFSMVQLIKNVAGTENVGGAPVYLPANGLSASPFATLMGRSIIPLEFAATLGTQTDIGIYDWTQYQLIVKGQAKRDISTHIRFLTDEAAMRFTVRCDGAPMWDLPITPLNGTATTSCFVTLDTRA